MAKRMVVMALIKATVMSTASNNRSRKRFRMRSRRPIVHLRVYHGPQILARRRKPWGLLLQAFKPRLKEAKVLGFVDHLQAARLFAVLIDFEHCLGGNIHVRLSV